MPTLFTWEDQFKVGALAVALATIVAVDMLDGVLDGRLQLGSMLGR